MQQVESWQRPAAQTAHLSGSYRIPPAAVDHTAAAVNWSVGRAMNAEQPGQIVIAGGSGFLGTSLARHLAQTGLCAGLPTPHIVILSRTPPKALGPWQHVAWD